MRRTVRHEWKYQVSTASAVLLARRLAVFLKRDIHGGTEGYRVCSLYFDDIAQSAFYDKLAGINEREKYRLRYYDDDIEHIFLERKRKHGNLIEKDSVPVSRDVSERMMHDTALGLQELSTPLLADYSVYRSTRLMRPCVVVDYRRLAFVYQEQNVRITLDSDIRSGMFRMDSFINRSTKFPVYEKGDVILEVKYDEYLPDLPREALACISVAPQANSKFCQCVLPMIQCY